MSFTSKNLQTTRRSGLSVLKGATLFFLGMSAVVFMTRGYLEITTDAINARQVIESIFLSKGGDPNAATGIFLDGSGGNAHFAGNVGIGTENITHKLTVAGTGAFSGVCLGNDCRSTWPVGGGGSSVWSTGSSNSIYYTLGNVGIGTGSPSHKLTVDGTGKFNEVTFPGGSNLKQESTSTGNMHIVGGEYRPGDHGNIILTHNGDAKGGEIGVGTSNPLAKLHIHGATLTIPLLSVTKNSDSYFHIDNLGKVGIGTDAPSHKLTVDGTSMFSGQIRNKGGMYIEDGSDIILGGHLGGKYGIGVYWGFGTMGVGKHNIAVWGEDGGVLGIWDSNGGHTQTGVLMWGNAGIGIGTGNITHKLTVDGTGKFTKDLIVDGRVGIGIPNPSKMLVVGGDARFEIGESDGGFTIYHGPEMKDVMRVDSDAVKRVVFDPSDIGYNVGIGTNNPSYKLTVAGTGKFTNDLIVDGSVTATAFLYNSDKRYKTDIKTIVHPLDKILALNGYMFTWKSNKQKSMGVIAQEVEKVFPEIVHTNEAGYKSVEYGNLVAPLIEAVKELNDKLDHQQQEIDHLKKLLKK